MLKDRRIAMAWLEKNLEKKTFDVFDFDDVRAMVEQVVCRGML